MKEGTKLLIQARSEERTQEEGRRKTLPEIEVTVVDTIQDIRNVVIPNGDAFYPVVTKYLVKDKENNAFSIYTHQVRKILN